MTSSTIPQLLDEIQSSIGDREAVACRSAASMSKAELIDLMLVPLLAGQIGTLTLDKVTGDIVNVFIGRSGRPARINFGRPSDLALVVLTDRDVALVSDEPMLLQLWGLPLTVTAADLLQALQFARDDADDELYWPAAYRGQRLVQAAEAWGLPMELLRSISVNRSGLMLEGRLLGA